MVVVKGRIQNPDNEDMAHLVGLNEGNFTAKDCLQRCGKSKG